EEGPGVRAEPALEDINEANDADAFRRLANSRKKKSADFLGNSKTRYYLLSTLTLAHICSPVTSLLFRSTSVDAAMTYRPSKSSEIKKRRRLHFKAPAAPGPPATQDDSSEGNFGRLPAVVGAAIDRLWRGLLGETDIFQIAMTFWPEAEPLSSMHKCLSNDILAHIAALKWRVLSRVAEPPFSAIELQRYLTENGSLPVKDGDVDDDVSFVMMARHCQKLCSMNPCCCEPNFARPVREQLLALPETDRLACFALHMSAFLRSMRGCSLQEEVSHSLQRKIASGSKGPSARQHSQAAGFVVKRLAESYVRRGGRNLDLAPKSVQRSVKIARVKKIIHKRPQQQGHAFFTYFAAERQKGNRQPKAEILQTWKNMDVNRQLMWKSRQVLQVQQRRRAEQAMLEEKKHVAFATAWHVGDNDYPLRQSFLDDFLRPFSSRASGLAKLSDPAFMEDESCKMLVDKVRNKGWYYHSMDAASLACKILVAPEISAEGQQANAILASRCEAMPCHMKHAGLCATKDAARIDDVNSFIQAFPKEPCVLRCEAQIPGRTKVVVYAKAILGTKRPLRMFYAWLKHPSAGHAAKCELAFPANSCRPPHELVVSKLPPAFQDSDVCDVWTPYEFGLHLLAVAKPKAWRFSSMCFEQRSLAKIVVSGIDQDLARVTDNKASTKPGVAAESDAV
ncbi:crcB, partial [Symbiodinium sp. CCMP2456]